MEKWLRIVKPPGTTGRDETFTQDKLGCVNITLLCQAIAQGNGILPYALVEFDIDADARLTSSKADINPERLARVTDEEARAVPIVLIRLRDGTAVCADGQHRLRYMCDHNWKVGTAFIVWEEHIEPYRIRFEESDDEGKTWREIDYGQWVKDWRGHFPQHQAGVFQR